MTRFLAVLFLTGATVFAQQFPAPNPTGRLVDVAYVDTQDGLMVLANTLRPATEGMLITVRFSDQTVEKAFRVRVNGSYKASAVLFSYNPAVRKPVEVTATVITEFGSALGTTTAAVNTD